MEIENTEEKGHKDRKYANPHLFEYLNNILVGKDIELYERHVSDECFSSFPHLVILRYLSMSPDENVRRIVTRNQILLERLDKIGHRFSYRWYIDNIPKQRIGFIRYIK